MKIKPTIHIIISFILFLGILTGCDNNRVFENNEGVEDFSWKYEESKEFKVHIEDTSEYYKIYVNIRHSKDYPYRNIWVNVTTAFPSGKEKTKRVNLPLADKQGHWHGNCLGDICDVRVTIQEKALFPERGVYRFDVEHIMRKNPLPGVMGVGLRVEAKKINKKSTK